MSIVTDTALTWNQQPDSRRLAGARHGRWRDEVLRLAKLFFFAKTTQISVIFCVSKFWKMGNFAISVERPITKTVSALRGVLLDPAGGSAPRSLL